MDKISALRPDEPAYINTLTPDLLGNIFTFTESYAAESFVSKCFFASTRRDLLCHYFFCQLQSIVGEDYSDDFDSIIDRQEGDSWVVTNQKAIKYFNDLSTKTGLGPIVLPKQNGDYFSTSLISIYQEGFQKVKDKNLITFCMCDMPIKNVRLIVQENYPEFRAFKNNPQLSLQELSALVREYLKKNDIFQINELTVCSKPLTLLPPEISGFTTLTMLSLFSNQLRSLPKSINKLVNLTELDLCQNSLEKLPSPLLTLSSLKTLTLVENIGEKCLETFGDLTNLTTFHLKSNLLENLPQSFSTLRNLTKLDLRIPITDFPSCILGLSKLRELNFEANIENNTPMNSLESFGRFTNLTSLALVGYAITNPPESLSNLVNLTTLNLIGTKIETPPTCIFKLPNLKNFHFDFTPLKMNGLANRLHEVLPNLEHPKTEVNNQ